MILQSDNEHLENECDRLDRALAHNERLYRGMAGQLRRKDDEIRLLRDNDSTMRQIRRKEAEIRLLKDKDARVQAEQRDSREQLTAYRARTEELRAQLRVRREEADERRVRIAVQSDHIQDLERDNSELSGKLEDSVALDVFRAVKEKYEGLKVMYWNVKRERDGLRNANQQLRNSIRRAEADIGARNGAEAAGVSTMDSSNSRRGRPFAARGSQHRRIAA